MTTLVEAPVQRRLQTVVPASALRLGIAARRALAEAEQTRDVGERYAAAHLAALRAAAAVLAAEARPEGARPTRRTRPTSVWTLLTRVAPELGEWAAFFAAGADKRIAAQAGLRGAVTAREADDLLRDASSFLELVAVRLGLPPRRQPMLPLAVYPANGEPAH
ncbi:MAG TPA: SAV_6107 family HEPN domain-containing protein [Mycobacteriales bacterium]|nr:SAV_6107 family HEPN domain-containing protein [Mycobacteriales bacterium]